MISPARQQVPIEKWPPAGGETVTFVASSPASSGAGVSSSTPLTITSETAILKTVRWGLVWRDFVLEDGRVIPEHRIAGCPQPHVWRDVQDVTEDEREQCEQRLLAMAGAGMDPRQRDQAFWSELNQYLAYTYLKFKPTVGVDPDVIADVQQKATAL